MRREIRKALHKTGMAVCGVLLTFGITAAAYAASGSIAVSLKDLDSSGSDRAGVEVQMYRVGDVDTDHRPVLDARYGIGEYPQDGGTLDAAAAKIAGQITEPPARTGKTDAQGSIRFNRMEDGVYLITIPEDNHYGTVSPFLVQLPYYEEVNGVMEGPIYEVEAQPKASPYEPEEPEKPVPPDKPVKPDRPTKPDKPVKPQDGQPSRPAAKTGDTNETAGYALMAGLAITGILYIRIRRRREA